jgi:hypothetical protein
MVRKAVNSAWPEPRKASAARYRLRSHEFVVDQVLRADLDAPRKQRHTVTRILHRLVGENEAEGISYQMVRRYVAERRSEILAASGKAPVEAFLPWSHQPGMEVEVDFGDMAVELVGERARRRPQADSFVSMTKLISMTWPGKVSSVTPKTVLAGRWSPKYPRLPSAVAAAFCRRFTTYRVCETIWFRVEP